MKDIQRKLLLGVSTLLFACLLILLVSQWDQRTSVPFCVRIGAAGEQVIPWENDHGDYYVFLPGYADISDIYISMNTTEEVVIGENRMADGTSCAVFQLNEPYELIFPSAKEEGAHHLTFLQSSNTATMYIETASGRKDYIHAKKGNEESGVIRLYTSKGTLEYDGVIESIKGRGNSTWDVSEKKPYNLRLLEETNLLNLGKANNWILLANAYDPSNMRNKIVFDFAAKIGLMYSPNSQWIDLYLNGEYEGLYLLCECNELHEERVAIPREGSFLVSAERETKLRENKQQYFLTNDGQALRIHYADATVDLAGKMQSVENALLAEDGIDYVTGKSWTELIDLESWVRKYLIEEVFGNTDGGALSQFYYLDGSDLTGKVCAGPVWDYDASLGAEVSWQIPSTDVFFANRPWIRADEKISWYHSLYKKEEFLSRVIQIYETEFLPLIQEIIDNGISAYAKSIVFSAKMDALRWNLQKNYEDEVENISRFLVNRTEFLSALWLEGKTYRVVSVYPGRSFHHLYYPVEEGQFLMELPDLSDKDSWRFLGWYYAENNELFNRMIPITEDMEVYARWEEPDKGRDSQITKLMPLAIITFIGICILCVDIGRTRKGG